MEKAAAAASPRTASDPEAGAPLPVAGTLHPDLMLGSGFAIPAPLDGTLPPSPDPPDPPPPWPIVEPPAPVVVVVVVELDVVPAAGTIFTAAHV